MKFEHRQSKSLPSAPCAVVSPDCLEGPGKSLFSTLCWGSGQQGSVWQVAPFSSDAPVAGVKREGGREAGAVDPRIYFQR